MPRGNGTGSLNAAGAGRGGGKSRGRLGGLGAGLGGACVCPNCAKLVPHQRGVPCNNLTCPACGQLMTRQV